MALLRAPRDAGRHDSPVHYLQAATAEKAARQRDIIARPIVGGVKAQHAQIAAIRLPLSRHLALDIQDQVSSLGRNMPVAPVVDEELCLVRHTGILDVTHIVHDDVEARRLAVEAKRAQLVRHAAKSGVKPR